MENLLDVHQVSAIMRIHHKKVQRLARTGVLPCIKIGAVYRFRAAALEAWMETHEVSERKSAQGRSELGVSVQRLGGHTEAEDAKRNRIPISRLGQSGLAKFDIFPKRP